MEPFAVTWFDPPREIPDPADRRSKYRLIYVPNVGKTHYEEFEDIAAFKSRVQEMLSALARKEIRGELTLYRGVPIPLPKLQHTCSW